MGCASNKIAAEEEKDGEAPVVEIKGGEKKIYIQGRHGSGKSTFLKQFRILHQNGFPHEERLVYQDLLRKNLLDEACLVWDYCTENNIELSADCKEVLQEIEDGNIRNFRDNNAIQSIKEMWEKPEVQLAYNNKMNFNDSGAYYFENMERIASEDFVVNDQDILRSRQMTTGIQFYKLALDDYEFTFFDTGGECSNRGERMKLLEGLSAFVFVVALSEYDQVLMEDHSTNRIHDSLMVFQQIVEFTLKAGGIRIYLLFNKCDVFAEKIKTIPLTVCFPRYKGPPNDYEAASQYILRQYLAAFKKVDVNHAGQLHTLPKASAIDTDNMRGIFEEIFDTSMHSGMSTKPAVKR